MCICGSSHHPSVPPNPGLLPGGLVFLELRVGERQKLCSQVLYEGAAFHPSSEESSRYWLLCHCLLQLCIQSANAELSQQILSTCHVQALGAVRLFSLNFLGIVLWALDKALSLKGPHCSLGSSGGREGFGQLAAESKRQRLPTF